MKAVEELVPVVGAAPACEALGVPRASFYRQKAPPPDPAEPRRRPNPPQALSDSERREVLDVLHSPRFVDKAPAEVYAALLDEGIYLCSVRTMYRILAANEEVRERRNQLRHPHYQKPVENPQVPAGVPEPLRFPGTRQVLLRAVLRLVQPPALPLRHRPPHPGHGPLRPGRCRHRRSTTRSRSGLHRSSRAFRQPASLAPFAAHRGLDQSAATNRASNHEQRRGTGTPPISTALRERLARH